MKAKTKQALLESIQHWERLANGESEKGEWTGPDDCSLCKMFAEWHRGYELNCEGCPVYEKTGEHGCWNTPHERMSDLCNTAQTEIEMERLKDTTEFYVAAQAELEFLKSLLPKDENEND